MTLRKHVGALLAALSVLAVPLAQAQETPVKFQLDWRFEGPAALFLVPAAKGYFKAEKLDVTIDAGNGSGGTVTRVASGTYDMGFADMAALMEFHANNPTAPNKPVAVMMVYNNTPAAVLALKKIGHQDAGRPERQEARRAGVRRRPQGLPDLRQGQRRRRNVTWTAMDPPLRETMLVRGDVDAITGFSFTSLLNLEARGVKAEDIVVLPYPQYGVKLYGNAIIVARGVPEEEPGGGEGLPARLHQGREGRDRRPEGGDRDASRRATASSTRSSRLRRLKLALDAHRADRRREGRRLRRRLRPAPGADGEPGVRRVRDQGARRPGRRSGTRRLPAVRRPSATSSRPAKK